ncbi:DUF5113 domain-containing protein [Bacteroides sp. 224]|uniref:DUF5113 domain-containing protein n=1 Tax=Bacteroides sp. 224 TaxID=2302936 RepID=UPI0013CFAAA7|nr:DUF5113 domain-containing protein [Bacteroides sp. 224]NDV65891.1 DUF5113 domain-containing protein [Bacteroides sp. 224]
MNHRYPVILFVLILFSFLFSCVGTAPTKEVQILDSLNRASYAYRYKNLDSSYYIAWQAYEEASLYSQGKAEACNNLAFCSFMQMNFDMAEKLHKEVYDLTQNELELLIADIGLMKIYQRTAMNKEFYDYLNSAISRMKRIDEERNLFIDTHEVIRLNYAYTEYFITSAIYYYYLRQFPEAAFSINQIRHEELASDTNQLLYYHYIKGTGGYFTGLSLDDRRLSEFDELFYTWQHASNKGYLYFEANGLQGLANLMASPDDYDFFYQKRFHALTQFDLPVDNQLPLELGTRALAKFKKYNDIYQIAGTYVTISRYLNSHGYYDQALDSLTKALEYVNLHHKLYYANTHEEQDVLKPYVEKETVRTEIRWVTGKDIETGQTLQVKTVPEWISSIREQLSVSYAGLGMKAQSNYNRNVYMEILEFTRQDKESESRYLALEKESKQLNVVLLFVILSIVLVISLFWIFNNRTKVRNRIYTSRLKKVLDICQKIMASVPAHVTEEKDIVEAIVAAILPDMQELFHVTEMRISLFTNTDDEEAVAEEDWEGMIEYPLYVPDKEQPIGIVGIQTSRSLSKDEQALLQVITPYIAWTVDNGITFIMLGDEQENLEKQKYIFEQHIARNKRENLIKKACLSIVNGIIPYIDRIINEVYKLKEKGFIKNESIKLEKFQYIDELVTTINEYNDILALWIKMKQGSLSLNIENFALNDLFLLILKGRKTFEMKHQTFDVETTDAIIKADKALTLFMINTLTENARKYTTEGGTVKVYARATDEYVEISVEDNGRGLSAEDVALIQGEKIYNSHLIGVADESDVEELKRQKGSGFGLMNCKGIIEKYRKTNKIFQVCLFGVDSTLGKGSRFFFRLPLGVRKKMMLLLCLLLPLGALSARETDPVYEQLLDEASAFRDTARYCNVMAEYDLALQYIDSSMHRLNQHYRKYGKYKGADLTLKGEGTPAELIWWDEKFDTDYSIVLFIRNEAAVAFLALKNWDAYSYNNKAWESLFKLFSEDPSWERYSLILERSTTNKKVGLIICILLLIVSLTGYYFLYMRKRLMNRWNLEQVLEINKTIYPSSLIRPEENLEALQKEENTLKEIPRKIVTEAFEPLNELLEINRLGIAVYNEARNQLELAANPVEEHFPDIVRKSFEQKKILIEDTVLAFPLIVEVAGNNQCVGVFYLEKQEVAGQETYQLLLELIARYIAIVVFNSVVKLAMRYRDIESAYEDTHRASWEDSMLHVQNMVLDNCLSTIKHETIYYPNKIKQIIDKLNSGNQSREEEDNNIETITELIEYYKGIFTILSSCASRQLEEVTFRRTNIPVSVLLKYAEKYFSKINKGNKNQRSLKIDEVPPEWVVVGDLNQLNFLFENLIDESLSVPLPGELQIKAYVKEEFVYFLFTDSRRNKDVEELNQLFYPNLNRMTSGEKGELRGTEYLVCKQIIRDHDEYASRRGCRINAEPAPDGGFTVYFTIPKK